MTVMQIFGAFRLYRWEVLLLAFGVTLCVSLLKKILPERCPKKVYLFAPFLLGLLFYAAYAAIRERSAVYLVQNAATVLENGFACGCAATLYYLTYEQFFRAKKKQPTLSSLLDGIVPQEKREQVLNALLSCEKQGEELARFVRETLKEYGEPLSDAELCASAKIIAELLPTLR